MMPKTVIYGRGACACETVGSDERYVRASVVERPHFQVDVPHQHPRLSRTRQLMGGQYL